MSSTPRNFKKHAVPKFTEISEPFFVADYRNVCFTFVGTSVAGVQIYGSLDLNEPDFSAPSTIGNSYREMVMAELNTPASYVTSLPLNNETKMVEVNTNVLGWVCVKKNSGDPVQAFITYTDNQ